MDALQEQLRDVRAAKEPFEFIKHHIEDLNGKYDVPKLQAISNVVVELDSRNLFGPIKIGKEESALIQQLNQLCYEVTADLSEVDDEAWRMSYYSEQFSKLMGQKSYFDKVVGHAIACGQWSTMKHQVSKTEL